MFEKSVSNLCNLFQKHCSTAQDFLSAPMASQSFLTTGQIF